ncbi:MAG: HD-GYP domain-containing protein, partial [Alphaproteobacteria bacterium]|nr:HD-GYP domain-containing protein [Alphaproteobacteria bacterium]
MLKKIATRDVKLGMYLQAMEGSWLSHPFWKTRFVIRDQADLDSLQASAVEFVWIDVSKGLDVVGEPEVEAVRIEAAAPDEPPPFVAPAATPVAMAPPARASMTEEMARAAQIVNRSREAVTHLFGEARLGKAIEPEQCLPLVEEVASSVSRNPSALISLARLKTKDDYTYMHSVAVCALMIGLSRQLGLSEAQTREAGLAGLLHDVGKMAMPLDVLNKPGKLTDEEFDVMRSHPERGWAMLSEGGAVPASALDVCLHHHEKIDGSGYPKRLKGEQISRLARMGAICDVYDAITSNRPYKTAWDPA